MSASYLYFCEDVLDGEMTRSDKFPSEVVPNGDVLRPRMEARFCASASAPRLSSKMIGSAHRSMMKSLRRPVSQTTSFAAWHMAIQPASTDERATEVYFFAFHEIAPSPIRTMYALVDFWSSRSPPQSESIKSTKSTTSPPRLRVQFFVPLRYSKTTASSCLQVGMFATEAKGWKEPWLRSSGTCHLTETQRAHG